MRKIIGITGHDGSGKSTLAKAIQADFGGTIVPFAEAIRQDLLKLGFDEATLRRKPTADHMRELFRAFGKAKRKELGANVFIKRWEAVVADLPEDALVIVDDLRYVNELIALIGHGAMVISVESLDSEPDPALIQPEVVEMVWSVRARLNALCAQQTDVSAENPSRYQLRMRKPHLPAGNPLDTLWLRDVVEHFITQPSKPLPYRPEHITAQPRSVFEHLEAGPPRGTTWPLTMSKLSLDRSGDLPALHLCATVGEPVRVVTDDPHEHRVATPGRYPYLNAVEAMEAGYKVVSKLNPLEYMSLEEAAADDFKHGRVRVPRFMTDDQHHDFAVTLAEQSHAASSREVEALLAQPHEE